MVVAVLVFVFRPSGTAEVAAASASATQAVPAAAPVGDLVCTFVPDRSRVTVSKPGEIDLKWGPGGCAGGKTQYVDRGGRWERTLVPQDDQTVSTMSYDPARRVLTDTRYLLSSSAMEALRKLRGKPGAPQCQADTRQLALTEDALRSALPPLPNEKLVYSCAPKG